MSFQIPKQLSSTTLPAIQSASILICIDGIGSVSNSSLLCPIDLKRGTTLFISANQSTDLTVKSSNGMLLYRALAGL